MDSTQRKVISTVYSGVVAAYGHNPYAAQPDDPDAPCGTCEHRQDEHTGEEWEGPCGVVDCTCGGFVPTDRSAERDD